MKKNCAKKYIVAGVLLLLVVAVTLFYCQSKTDYIYTEYPLSRNGISLHLDCIKKANTASDKNILFVHGLTYSSHEFDLNYKDYSLVRFFAGHGYSVWRLDIAGYGQSGLPKNGFVPDSRYAAMDINAAVDKILQVTGQKQLDLLGWSWGTVTSSIFCTKYPQKVDKLILYAPIIYGLGEVKVDDDYHINDWKHAASDFQLTEDGEYDLSIVEKEVIDIYCSNCWRYDAKSPNGGRRDLMVSNTATLINLTSITVPTLVIYGDKDPYLNLDKMSFVLEELPPNSELKKIKGASHMALIEKPYYKEFRNCILSFLNKNL